MQMRDTLFAVRDLRRSLEFYRKVLGLEAVNDFGANVVPSGGLALQTLDSRAGFLEKEPGTSGLAGTTPSSISRPRTLTRF